MRKPIAAAVAAALAISTLSLAALGQQPDAPSPPPRSAPTYRSGIVLDVAGGFVPYVNDVPLMAGAGVRVGGVHEIWARGGYQPVGDDAGYGFGCLGYRAVLRPGRVVRPVLGGLAAGLPATCGHDDAGRPVCTPTPIFVFAATGGVRVEPVPWMGISALLSLGVDTYPYPFGMIELVQTFVLPLS